MSQISTITGKVTLNRVGVPNLVAWLDVNNSGILPALPNISISETDGTIQLVQQVALNNAVVRLILPPAYVQVSPANNYGAHVTVALGGTAEANFVLSLVANSNSPVNPPPATVPPVPPTPPAAQAFTFGFNAPDVSQTVVNAACSALAQFKCTLIRYFGFGAMTAAGLSPMLTPAQWYKAKGVSSVIVENFQDSGGLIPDIATWTARMNAYPTSAESGIVAVEIGNEIDTATYLVQASPNFANYAAAFKVASPILRAKGYKVIVGNVVSWGAGSAGQALYEMLQTNGVFAVADGAGGHFYDGDAATSISAHKALIAWLAAIGVPYYCTEFGLHGGSDWAAQITLLLAWAVTVQGTFIYFCLQAFSPPSHASPEAPFDENWNQTSFYTAMKAGLV
jgi:hypothetical protein